MFSLECGIVRSIDFTQRKEYNYFYEEDKLVRANECSIEIDENLNVVGKTVDCYLLYTYDAEGNQTKDIVIATLTTVIDFGFSKSNIKKIKKLKNAKNPKWKKLGFKLPINILGIKFSFSISLVPEISKFIYNMLKKSKFCK